MTANGERTDPWGSFEPYAQLIRSLMPRAISVTVFDAQGEMRWTSETTTGPDLAHLIVDVLPSATAPEGGAGLLRAFANSPPVYFCWLKDERKSLVAIVAVVCRRAARLKPIRRAALRWRTHSCGPHSNACDATCSRARSSTISIAPSLARQGSRAAADRHRRRRCRRRATTLTSSGDRAAGRWIISAARSPRSSSRTKASCRCARRRDRLQRITSSLRALIDSC